MHFERDTGIANNKVPVPFGNNLESTLNTSISSYVHTTGPRKVKLVLITNVVEWRSLSNKKSLGLLTLLKKKKKV